jgi:hypothetical protein
MASIKFGNMIVDARGKINGNVYSKNKGGAYARVRVKPSNPRARLTSLSQAWKALTATQIAGWNQGAINFPKSNRVGDRHIINGNSLYVALNKNLADVGIAAISNCPAPASVSSVVVSSAVAANSADTVVITLSGAVPANTSLKVFASGTVSAGVNSIGTKMRQIQSFAAAHVAALDISAAYVPRMGAVGAVGSKIFYKIIPVNATTGQAGAAISGSIIIS